jgi:hypothetical protein
MSLSSFWYKGTTLKRTGYGVGMLLLASGLIHLAILGVSGGSWQGPLSLRKAMTFGLSFGLTLITITWVTSFVRLGERSRAVLLGTFTVACVLETILVSLQAWRGVPSHYNTETAFDGFVARSLAGGGVVLVAIIGVLTFASFRDNPPVPVSLRIAVRAGFVALFGSLIIGAVMIAKGMLLVLAGNPQLAYATGGSLKPTHAVTMHAILVLPLLAWLLSFAEWSEPRRVQVVLIGIAGYVVLAGVVAIENVAGVDPSEVPVAMIALFTFGTLALAAAGLTALAAAARRFKGEHS